MNEQWGERRTLAQGHRRYDTLGLARGCEAMADFVISLPERFERGEGEVIYRGRNELRAFTYEGATYVAKAFHRPHLINAWAYGHVRPSKAERSLRNALRLTGIGVGTPRPIAYLEVRRGCLLRDSYYLTGRSACPYVYSQLFDRHFDCEDAVLREIGRVTGVMHNHGLAHLDYGRGNILFAPQPNGRVDIELVDLNRMHVGPLDVKSGCRNLERLPLTPHMRQVLAEAYAAERGFDADEVYSLLEHYRSTQPGKIDGKY